MTHSSLHFAYNNGSREDHHHGRYWFHRQDYISWRDAFKALKAIGGNYTFNYERPYINRKVLTMLDNMPDARLEWKVVYAVSEIS